jgi:hypothetical protein
VFLGGAVAAPTFNNYAIFGDATGVTTSVNGSTNLFLKASNSTVAQITAGTVAVTGGVTATNSVLVGGSVVSAGGGIGDLQLAKATTNPTTSATNAIIYADTSSGAIGLYPVGQTTNAQESVTSSGVEVAGNLVVGATSFASGIGAGVLELHGAATIPTGTLTQSAVYAGASVGEINLWPAGAAGPTLQAGSLGSGVGVVGLLNAGTQPSGTPSGGVYLTSNSGAFEVYDTNGTNATLSGLGLTFGGGTANMTVGVASTTSTAGSLNITGQTTTAASGGATKITTGVGSTVNGFLTLSSGAGTVYTATGQYSSGNTPGNWTWTGPAVTNTQSATLGKTVLSATGSYAFLPVTINGSIYQIVLTQ